MPRTPTIGEPVQYTLRNGQARAALVTNIFGGTVANLTVFLDQSNDLGAKVTLINANPTYGQPASKQEWRHDAVKPGLIPPGASQGHTPGTLAAGSTPYDPTGQPGTWRYLTDAVSTTEGGAA